MPARTPRLERRIRSQVPRSPIVILLIAHNPESERCSEFQDLMLCGEIGDLRSATRYLKKFLKIQRIIISMSINHMRLDYSGEESLGAPCLLRV
jgi:hypothetical protein